LERASEPTLHSPGGEAIPDAFALLGDRGAEGNSLNNLGNFYSRQGQLEAAREHFQAAQDIHRALGNRRAAGHALNNLGDLYLEQHRLEAAATALSQGEALLREVGDKLELARLLSRRHRSAIDRAASVSDDDLIHRGAEKEPPMPPMTRLALLTALAGCAPKPPADSAPPDSGAAPANQPPSAEVTLSPAAPTTEDYLRAEVTADDPDGDAVTLEIVWTIDGVESGHAGWTVPPEDTARGQRWAIAATPSDGVGAGEAASASVTVGDAPPSIASLRLGPEPAFAGSTLVAEVEAADADGDAVALAFAWTVDGAPVPDEAGDTLGGGWFDKHQVVIVEVTPSAGSAEGEPATSAPLTIQNSPPAVTALSLEPAAVFTDDLLTAAAEAADADGDAVALRYTWRVDGVEVKGAEGEALDGALYFDRDQVVSVEATPSDEEGDGEAARAEVTVGNSPPSILGVAIEPDGATAADTLSCHWLGFDDPDGDPDASSWAWSIGGASLGVDVPLEGGFVRGDVVRCEVTPGDGDTEGEPLRNESTIQNAPPSVASVSITPSPARAGDALTCSWSGFADLDGDADASTLEWTIDGAPAGTDAALRGGFAGGDEVRCRVTPHDGRDPGEPLDDAITIENTPPEVLALTLTPEVVTTDGVLTAAATTADADGDDVDLHIEWYVDGALVSEGASTLDGARFFDRGEAVHAVATPSDAASTGAAVASSPVVVKNAPPGAPEVVITPEDALLGDDLVCAVAREAEDPDGDAVSYTFDWSVDGAVVLAGTETAQAEDLSEALWTCAVTPSDGADDGEPGEASADLRLDGEYFGVATLTGAIAEINIGDEAEIELVVEPLDGSGEIAGALVTDGVFEDVCGEWALTGAREGALASGEALCLGGYFAGLSAPWTGQFTRGPALEGSFGLIEEQCVEIGGLEYCFDWYAMEVAFEATREEGP